DLQASFDANHAMGRSLRWLRENDPENARGVDTGTVPAHSIDEAARLLTALVNLGPNAEQAERQTAGRAFFEAMQGLYMSVLRNTRFLHSDPERQKIEIATNMELLRRSLNERLQAARSPISFGRLRIAVDIDGHMFFGMPVMNGNVQTDTFRFMPPL